ncbi:uncharacterized protein LOC131954770 isoform X2 [Physella acuta]|uniref:uncharacterized protein LOC131954770 isoform X2 n=1 Tax=Physella acuta TaxID=109671 RepID=UPI0027DD2E3F|nr:uncharacterized protein LOC131954770 isoform X2 [Physella acuta]
MIMMEEVEETEVNDQMKEAKLEKNAANDLDETTEVLMTDMKLEDEIDEIRETEPGFNWTYHIEIYPWNADDMTENFVRLIKLAQFSQIFMRKKGTGKESGEGETIDDKLPARQRKGVLHLYTDSWQNAKNIMRSATWKKMAAKLLSFDIIKKGPEVGQIETAHLELDTYLASKARFRDKPKGELINHSAKVSNLPGTISREFLDVVFSRAYAVIGGTNVREYLIEKEGKLQQKLNEIKDFNGTLDFDCLRRGSCRAFVLAHKSVLIDGKNICIEAKDKETMNAGANKMPEKETVTTTQGARDRKPGPGMPVPMTGRQKMNEKMRRNNFALAAHHSGMYPMPGHLLGARGPVPNSVGDSFKQEIAFLQNELERSTQALEAKIAMLQHTSHEAAFYDGNINVYDTRDWLNEDIGYAYRYKFFKFMFYYIHTSVGKKNNL